MTQPGQWMEVLDENTQRTFWYNPDTEESTWENPYIKNEKEAIVNAKSMEKPIDSNPTAAGASEWQAVLDETTNRTYYWNPATKQSTWEKPDGYDSTQNRPAAATPQSESLRETETRLTRQNSSENTESRISSWVEIMDPDTKRTYWYNQKSGASQWTEPTSSDESSDDEGEEDNVHHPKHRHGGWEKVKDETTGRTFYYNKLTGVSQWELPPELEDVVDSPIQSHAPEQNNISLPETAQSSELSKETNEQASLKQDRERSSTVDELEQFEQTENTALDGSSKDDSVQNVFSQPATNITPAPTLDQPLTGTSRPAGDQLASIHSSQNSTDHIHSSQNSTDHIHSSQNSTDQAKSSSVDRSSNYVLEQGGRDSPSKEMLRRSTRLSYDEASTWEELRDPNTKRVFFFNRQDGRSQWERPDVLVPTLQVKRRSVSIQFDPKSNWETLRDPDTQQVFYFNRKTGMSQWECPDELENIDLMAAPTHNVLKRAESVHYDAVSQWEKMLDPKSRREFYHNHKTGHLQWGVPLGFNQQAVEAQAAPASPSHADHPPAAWREVVDPNSGRSFFFNEVSRDTRWVLPDDLMELIKNRLNVDIPAASQGSDSPGAVQSADAVSKASTGGSVPVLQGAQGSVLDNTRAAQEATGDRGLGALPAASTPEASTQRGSDAKSESRESTDQHPRGTDSEADRASVFEMQPREMVVSSQQSQTPDLAAAGAAPHRAVLNDSRFATSTTVQPVQVPQHAQRSTGEEPVTPEQSQGRSVLETADKSQGIAGTEQGHSEKGESAQGPVTPQQGQADAAEPRTTPLPFVLSDAGPPATVVDRRPTTGNGSEDSDSIPPPPPYSPPPGLTEADWLVRWRRARGLRRKGAWEEMLDINSGKVFYFCTSSSLGQFHPPPEFEEPQTGGSAAGDPLGGIQDPLSRPGYGQTGNDSNNKSGEPDPAESGSLEITKKEASPSANAWDNMMAGFRALSLPPSGHRSNGTFSLDVHGTNAISNLGVHGTNAISNLGVHGTNGLSNLDGHGTNGITLDSATISNLGGLSNLGNGGMDLLNTSGNEQQSPRQRGPLKARCLRSHAATGPDELSFAQGDVLTILEHNELERWWKAELDGITGLILPSHVRLLSESVDNKSSPQFRDRKPSLGSKSPHSQQAAQSAKARMEQFTQRLERKQVEAQLVLLLRRLGIEPMKSLESYPTKDKLSNLGNELRAMNLRNHRLKVEVRGLQWVIHQKEKGTASPSHRDALLPQSDLGRSPDIPEELLSRYGDMLAELRANPALLASIGSCLNVEAQYIFASTVVNSLLDQYSTDPEPLMALVQAVIDLETSEQHYRDHPWSTDKSASSPFLPALLAAFAQRSECQSYLSAVLQPVKDDLAALLADTRSRNTWGDVGGTYQSRLGLPDASLRMVQIVLESMTAEAALAQTPPTLLRLCLMLNQVGGEVAVREFLTEVLLWPTLSSPGFYFEQGEAFDPSLEDVLWSRLDRLGEALQLMVAPPALGSGGLSNSHSSAMRSRTSVRLLDTLVDRLLSYRSVSAQLAPSSRAKEMLELVVVSCFDLYMLHLALDYYRARPHASCVTPHLASVLADFGKAKPLHTGPSDNPYIIVRLPGKPARGRTVARLMDDAGSVGALSAESSLAEEAARGGLSEQVYTTVVKARARVDAGLEDGSTPTENEELLHLLQSYEAEIRGSMEALESLRDGVELAQVFFNELLVLKSRLVRSDSSASVQIVPRLNEENSQVRKFKTAVVGRLLDVEDSPSFAHRGPHSSRRNRWSGAPGDLGEVAPRRDQQGGFGSPSQWNQVRGDETGRRNEEVSGLLSTVFNPLRLAEVDSETTSYQGVV